MFSPDQSIVLEDSRVLLRPLESEDLPLLLPFALQEPDTWMYSLSSPAGEAGMKKYLEQTLLQRKECREYPFIVFDKLTGNYAGSTRFYDIQPHNQSAQLGYTWYGREYRRTGLNRHCKLLMLTHAFESWELERVEFRADARNERSIEAMKAIGCQVEGILRSNCAIEGGGRRDSIILSILRHEWFGEVKQRLRAMIRD